MNSLIKNLLKYSVLYPVVVLRRMYDKRLAKNNPEKWFSEMHRRSTGVALNIDNPHNLNEKIAYMSFRTDTSKWTLLADKIGIHKYAEECGLNGILPKLYGTYSCSAEIDYDKLPNQFVIKTNNASATNIIVRDKSKLNIADTNRKLDKWLRIDYGAKTCQPHYSRIKPMILAEELLIDHNHPGQPLIDYKFYCVNGEPLYVFVYVDRKDNSHIMKRMVYDMQWNSHPEYLGPQAVASSGTNRPTSFAEMQKLARVLSQPFKFVRVDFYDIDNKAILGEMSFTPGLQEASVEFLDLLGGMIQL